MKRLIAIISTLLILSACSTIAVPPQSITSLPPTETLIPPSTSIPTSTPTNTPSPTPTNTPVPGIAEVNAVLIAENDEERTEAAFALAEYLNANTPKEAYVDLEQFGEPAGSILFWSTYCPYGGGGGQCWISSHTINIEPDYTLLPDAVLPGMTNDSGENVVFIDGQPKIVPEIDIPGLGTMSVIEMVNMQQNLFKQRAIAFMTQAPTTRTDMLDYLKYSADERYALPVIMLENIKNTYRQFPQNGSLFHGSSNYQLPNAGKTVFNLTTSIVLLPLTDPILDELIGWLRIFQSNQQSKTNTYYFTAGDELPNLDYVTNMGSKPAPNYFAGKNLYGAQDSHSFAILFPRKTATGDYINSSYSPILEYGEGIGNNSDIYEILSTESIEELLKVLEENKIFVTTPDISLLQYQP